MLEPERMEDQGRGVVPRIRRAVPEGEIRRVEFTRTEADQLRDGR